MKIVTVIGARPQFVKAAVVSREISKYDNIKECIIHTGQHFDKNMSTIFFEEMQIPLPDYNLNINGLSHGAMTGQMLEGIESILFKEKPDWVLVYGDTNSTLAGALAARKNHIKVAHVEAGLRSYNMDMPEEINRILTDRISDVLFCPTDTAIKNLWKEGFKNLDCEILKSGDVMKDAMSFYMNKASKPEYEIPEHFILCTVHRAENTDNEERMTSIIEALEVISSKYSPVVVPLHPRTEKKMLKRNYDFKTSKIHFIKPVGYFEMIWLIKHCNFVMTDSGGLQKEAYFANKYCITMRMETEWEELVKRGYNFISGYEQNKIIDFARKISSMPSFTFQDELYGNGNASSIIIKKLSCNI